MLSLVCPVQFAPFWTRRRMTCTLTQNIYLCIQDGASTRQEALKAWKSANQSWKISPKRNNQKTKNSKAPKYQKTFKTAVHMHKPPNYRFFCTYVHQGTQTANKKALQKGMVFFAFLQRQKKKKHTEKSKKRLFQKSEKCSRSLKKRSAKRRSIRSRKNYRQESIGRFAIWTKFETNVATKFLRQEDVAFVSLWTLM